MKRRLAQTFMLMASAMAIAGALQPAHAQGAYPNKPVKLIIGFGPGSGTDILARMIAEELRVALGQPRGDASNSSLAKHDIPNAMPKPGSTLLKLRQWSRIRTRRKTTLLLRVCQQRFG